MTKKKNPEMSKQNEPKYKWERILDKITMKAQSHHFGDVTYLKGYNGPVNICTSNAKPVSMLLPTARRLCRCALIRSSAIQHIHIYDFSSSLTFSAFILIHQNLYIWFYYWILKDFSSIFKDLKVVKSSWFLFFFSFAWWWMLCPSWDRAVGNSSSSSA